MGNLQLGLPATMAAIHAQALHDNRYRIAARPRWREPYPFRLLSQGEKA